MLFGGTPEEVAKRTEATVMVVKPYERVKAAIARVMAA